MEHDRQFVTVWTLIRQVNLDDDIVDSITWNLTDNGQYTSIFTCKVQFLGAASPSYSSSVSLENLDTSKNRVLEWLSI
jgi:hypothetical protein